MKTLSAEEAERLVSQISSQHGFIDYTDAGRQRRIVTAFPLKHWPVPKDALSFSRLTDVLEQAWAGLAEASSRELAGGIMGTLFYEAGNHTVPGFSGEASERDYGYIGLYLWQLTLDVSGANSPRLDFHPECDDRTRERVLNLTGEKPTRPTPFHISPGFTADQPAEHYRNGVSRVLSYIHAGDCYQVNLSNKYTGGYQGEPYTAFRALCQAVPVPHAAYINASGSPNPWPPLKRTGPKT